jgi:polar amino acid transport system substrate-binding protein
MGVLYPGAEMGIEPPGRDLGIFAGTRKCQGTQQGGVMRNPRSLIQAVVTLVAVAVLGVTIAACGSDSPSDSASASPTAGGFDISAVKADSALNAMLPDAIKSAGTIRVATNIPYPPWEMYTEVGSQQPTGIDFDLSQALAAKLGVKASFDQTPFDAIIPALLAGKEDMVMASMFDNAERQAELDFVDYATDGYGILLPKANPGGIQTVDDLAGKTIAVQSGTSQVGELQKLNERFKSEGKPEMEILQFPQDSDALLAVTSGKAVAQMDDESVAAYTVKTFNDGNTFMLLDDPSVSESFESAIIGIGIPKDDPQLRDAVQKALQSLIDDGTYLQILDKYGESQLAVTSAEINQGK